MSALPGAFSGCHAAAVLHFEHGHGRTAREQLRRNDALEIGTHPHHTWPAGERERERERGAAPPGWARLCCSPQTIPSGFFVFI